MEETLWDVSGSFLKIPLEDHTIIVDTDSDAVFFDGDRLNLNAGRPYASVFCERENLNDSRKLRVRDIPTKNHAIVVDVGGDGRLFVLYYTKHEFRAFRGKPLHKYSYWNDGKNKMFYIDDLTRPCWVKNAC